MCAYQGVRNISFLGKFSVLTKWMTPNEVIYNLSIFIFSINMDILQENDGKQN